MKNYCAPLEDIQSTKAKHPLAIDKVGIKDFHIPLVVRDLANEKQHSIAKVDMSVDLPADFKGTHMSRFIEALEEWRENSEEKLDYASLKNLLEQVRNKLNAQKAYLSFNFPYFITKKAPVSHAAAPVSYQCRFTGEWDKTWDKPAFLIEIEVPVTTVCPCSKAISKYGAHGQRTYIKMHIKLSKFSWIEEFVHIAEQAGSAPILCRFKNALMKNLSRSKPMKMPILWKTWCGQSPINWISMNMWNGIPSLWKAVNPFMGIMPSP